MPSSINQTNQPEQIFKYLDELEKRQSSYETNEQILDLMRKVAETDLGLIQLGERYGDSSNPIFPRTLSFLLATSVKTQNLKQDRNDLVGTDLWVTTLFLIQKLQCKQDESTLINYLNAIQEFLNFYGLALLSFLKSKNKQSFFERSSYMTLIQAGLGFHINDLSIWKSEDTLSEFILHCLDQTILVQQGAIAVLFCLQAEDLLLDVFSQEQIDEIRDKLIELSQLDNPLLNMEIEDLKTQGRILRI